MLLYPCPPPPNFQSSLGYMEDHAEHEESVAVHVERVQPLDPVRVLAQLLPGLRWGE